MEQWDTDGQRSWEKTNVYLMWEWLLQKNWTIGLIDGAQWVDRWFSWTSISTTVAGLKLTTVPGLPPSYGCQSWGWLPKNPWDLGGSTDLGQVHQGRGPAAWSGSQLSAAWRLYQGGWLPQNVHLSNENGRTLYIYIYICIYGDTVSYDISVTFEHIYYCTCIYIYNRHGFLKEWWISQFVAIQKGADKSGIDLWFISLLNET